MSFIDKIKRKFGSAGNTSEDFALVKESILFDANYYASQTGQTDTEPLMHYLAEGARNNRRPHPLFHERYYRASCGLNEQQAGLVHFLTTGLAEHRNPHPLFDSAFYLARYPDIAAAGINPFWHYLTAGYSESRDPHPLFDSKFYKSNLAVPEELQACGGNALVHYITIGSKSGLAPHPLFDGQYFLQMSGQSVDDDTTVFEKYLSAEPGKREFAHPLFDTNYYRDRYPDVAGSDALLHYLQHGYKEKRTPGVLFDSLYYKQTYSECKDDDPLLHFLQFNAQGNPNKLFDSLYYLRKYAAECTDDITSNPFLHYLKAGCEMGFEPALWFDSNFYRKQFELNATKCGALMKHYLLQPDSVATHPRLVSANKKTDKQDILVYSIVPWHSRIQRPQQLVREWVNSGHRVFYIDREFKHSRPGPGFSFEFVDENICVIQLHVSNPTVNLDLALPDQKQLAALIESLARVKEAFDLQNTLAVIQYASWKKLTEKFSADFVVFDCMDHVAGFDVGEAIVEEESALVKSADLMVVTSVGLQENFAADREDISIVRNAADVDFFWRRPASVHSVDGINIGYYGAISQWFDVDLVYYLAQSRPQWTFTLIGQITCDVSSLKKLANVRLLGEMDYSKLPEYLYGFDVCLIPFLLNELTRCTNPVKVYEYLAAGKAVVCTAMPELELLEELVSIGRTPDDFLQKIEHSLASDNEEQSKLRRHFVLDQSWKDRASQLLEEVRACQSALPRVSVVVLSYNNLKLTEVCLNSLLKYTNYVNWELIVVDNASSDGTPEYLTEFGREHPAAKIILNPENGGFSAGNNLGIKEASGDIVILLNNDTYVTDGWIMSLVRHFKADPELGLVGPVTNNIGNEAKIDIAYDSKEQIAAKALAYTSVHGRERLYVDNIAFFCAAISADAIGKIGLLDERFGLGFFEDDDYCKRARNAGFKIAIAEDCFIHHELSASWNANKQKQRDEYLERNKRIFEEKWGEPWKKHTYRR
jgi:GT2 family glycosyltransferase/glycosyltransferase involved in cell wall biosynthesis